MAARQPITLPPTDHVPSPYDGPSREKVLALRRQYLSLGLITYYKDPLLIGEVRGLGLMLGVELVKDRQSKEPATEQAAEVVEITEERGLLLGKGGLDGNTLRIKPPMCVTTDDADFLAACLDQALSEVGDFRG